MNEKGLPTMPLRLLASLAAALWLSGCARQQPPSAGEETSAAAQSPAAPISVETLVVRAAEHPATYEAPGTVIARQRVVLMAQAQGRVLSVAARLGDVVAAGQTLVEIERKELEAQERGAEATVAAAKQAIQQALKNLAALEADQQLAGLNQTRYRELFGKKSVSRQELDQAVSRYRVAEAMLEAARARILEAEAHHRAAAAALDGARTRLGFAAIAAPFSGRVVERHVDPGTLASPGAPLLTLEESRGFRLEAVVPESKAVALRVGAEAGISIPAIEMDTRGRVVEIEPSGSPSSRSSIVRVAIADAPGLRSGLFGRVAFPAAPSTALSIPSSAVVRDGQLSFVFVVADGVARRRLITLGRGAAGRVEALSGLADGDVVAVSDAAKLSDGARVESRP